MSISADRATQETIVSVRSGYRVLSNGRLVYRKDVARLEAG